MRKSLSIILITVMASFLTACTNSKPASPDYIVVESQLPSYFVTLPTPPPDLIPEETNSDGIDLDLTQMSSNIVYTEVYYMMITPDEFMGKTIKMSGTYTCFQDEQTGRYYHGCIVRDAAQCCAQGIEFRLTDEYIFPDDYPSEGDFITITGTFASYEENGNTYYTLEDAVLT